MEEKTSTSISSCKFRARHQLYISVYLKHIISLGPVFNSNGTQSYNYSPDGNHHEAVRLANQALQQYDMLFGTYSK
jgi:hypothetical protein